VLPAANHSSSVQSSRFPPVADCQDLEFLVQHLRSEELLLRKPILCHFLLLRGLGSAPSSQLSGIEVVSCRKTPIWAWVPSHLAFRLVTSLILPALVVDVVVDLQIQVNRALIAELPLFSRDFVSQTGLANVSQHYAT
jgi:hypothetical protein